MLKNDIISLDSKISEQKLHELSILGSKVLTWLNLTLKKTLI